MDLSVTAVDWAEPEGARLRRLQQEELGERYGREPRPGDEPARGDVAVFLLGRDRFTGEAVACGGLRPDGDGAAEIICMYVDPPHRNQGVSRTLLAELEREALALGWPVLHVDAGTLGSGATALYHGAGYRPGEARPAAGTPEQARPVKRLVKRLDAGPSTPGT